MIQMAHKGRTWFELNVEGITAHASMPEKGQMQSPESHL